MATLVDHAVAVVVDAVAGLGSAWEHRGVAVVTVHGVVEAIAVGVGAGAAAGRVVVAVAIGAVHVTITVVVAAVRAVCLTRRSAGRIGEAVAVQAVHPAVLVVVHTVSAVDLAGAGAFVHQAVAVVVEPVHDLGGPRVDRRVRVVAVDGAVEAVTVGVDGCASTGRVVVAVAIGAVHQAVAVVVAAIGAVGLGGQGDRREGEECQDQEGSGDEGAHGDLGLGTAGGGCQDV